MRQATIPPDFLLTSVDPGLTTGLALFQITEGAATILDRRAVRYDTVADLTPVDTILSWAAEHQGTPHVLLFEDFHIRPNQKAVDPTALRVLGALEDRLAPLGVWSRGGISRAAALAGAHHQAGAQAWEGVLGGIADRVATQGTNPYVAVIPQEPVEGKHMVTNAVLERLDMLAHGENSVHINDAIRHAVTLLAKRRHPWICGVGWPRDRDSA